MGRTATETSVEQHIVTEDDAKGLPAMLEEANQLTIAQAAVMDSTDVLKAIGRIESAMFFRQVGDKLIAETAINIREGKKYKGLPYKDAEGNLRQVGDFSEFCQVFLGKSYTRTMELISNYNQLGPDLYEQAERIGFRQRDYNALKALPADDRALIAQAIEEENLDKALDIMQEMAAKHVREKEVLGKKLDALTKDNQSKDDVIKQKIETNNKKDDEIVTLQTELANVRRDQPVYAHTQWPAAFHGYVSQLRFARKSIKESLGVRGYPQRSDGY